MSMAPRPQTMPSTRSPPKGSRFHPSGLTGTTSVWPISRRRGAFGSRPSIFATRLMRPGSDSWRSTVRPEPAKKSSSASTFLTSWPEAAVPSFTQAFLMSVRRSSVDSTSIARSSVMCRPSSGGG